MKKVFSILFIAFILMGCSNDSSGNGSALNANDMNVETADKSSNDELPFDVEKFEKAYYKEYDAFQEEYAEKFAEEGLEEEGDAEADLTIEETKLLFKDGKMTEAVVFLSVLSDMVDGEDEIQELATKFIEDILNDGSFASTSISDGLEIKIGAVDQSNISIGVFDADEQEEL